MQKLHTYSQPALRLGMGFVFIWFGWSGLAHPEEWIDLVPGWTAVLGSPETLVRLHGLFELVGGLLLVGGFYLRYVAGLLLLNLIHTITLLAPSAIMVRDIGLAAALLSLVLGDLKERQESEKSKKQENK